MAIISLSITYATRTPVIPSHCMLQQVLRGLCLLSMRPPHLKTSDIVSAICCISRHAANLITLL